MSNLLFLNPWLLVAFLALPALWFLLRITPPVPKRIFLPSARFLDGLIPKTRTPDKTPWWILLMRLIIATLLIITFAQPIFNPSQDLTSNNPIRIIVDNGWSSADIWDEKLDAIEDLLARADRQGLSVFLTTTAPEPIDGKPLNLGPLDPNEALSKLKGLKPYPWPNDLKAQNDRIKDNSEGIDSYYFSDGLNSNNLDNLIETLERHGQVHIVEPKPEKLSFVLSRDDDQDGDLSFLVHASETVPNGTPFTLEALGGNGQIIGVEQGIIQDQKTQITMQIPESLRANVTRVTIAEQNHAGAVFLFDDQFRKKRVGIASPSQEDEAKPFIEASFYLKRALEPYADISVGSIDMLLEDSLSMLILPDIGALSTDQLQKLDTWVKDGGLLLRFAGPSMEQARQHFLVPTPLRNGARSTDGALAWEKPPKLTTFSENSPLAGVELREDVVIKTQMLAEPTQDLSSKTWATLDDGTPLITADTFESGMVIMIHTTASPDWSNLPLSGAFVQILSRLVKIAGSAPDTLQNISGSLDPIRTLDGYGRLTNPETSTQPIQSGSFEKTRISYTHPPGIYGNEGVRKPLNFGDQAPKLAPIDVSGIGINTSHYDVSLESNLMPILLIAAFCLLLIDWVVMLALSSAFSLSAFKRATIMVAMCLLIPISGHAQTPKQYQYADGLYLGFIKSSNPTLNAQTRRGLEALKDALSARTSAEPEGVISLDPSTDILSFFPLIYWPLAPDEEPLSAEALRNVQDYLDHGGTILFDTREQISSSELIRRGSNSALANVTAGLNIPALAPIQDDHVLGKSFYLLSSFPGRYAGGTIWVESNSENGRDGVSSVLIGSHDWASAWAQSAGRNYRSGASARQRELALRFGINVMMYALTGNYKADQVHVKHILERLGQ